MKSLNLGLSWVFPEQLNLFISILGLGQIVESGQNSVIQKESTQQMH